MCHQLLWVPANAFGFSAVCGHISPLGLSALMFPVKLRVFVSINVWEKFLLGAEFMRNWLSQVLVVLALRSSKG